MYTRVVHAWYKKWTVESFERSLIGNI